MLLNIKHVVPVMIGDDCCESSDKDAVTHQMNLLTQEKPQPEDIQHNVTAITADDAHVKVNHTNKVQNNHFFVFKEQNHQKMLFECVHPVTVVAFYSCYWDLTLHACFL